MQLFCEYFKLSVCKIFCPRGDIFYPCGFVLVGLASASSVGMTLQCSSSSMADHMSISSMMVQMSSTLMLTCLLSDPLWLSLFQHYTNVTVVVVVVIVVV